MSLSATRHRRTPQISNIRRELAATQTETKPAYIYAGLKDGRGSITRYEKMGTAIPTRAFMSAYLKAGGSLDSCGVWGFHPEMLAHLEGRFTAQECAAALAIFGRADFLNMEAVAEILADGQPLNSPNYYAAVRGLERSKIVAASDCPTTKSVMGLGWMKQPKFDRMVANTMRAGDAAKNRQFNNWLRFDLHGNAAFEKARRDKFKRSKSIYIGQDEEGIQATWIDRRLNVLDVSGRGEIIGGTPFNGRSLKYEAYCFRKNIFRKKNFDYVTAHTSAGRIIYKTVNIDHSESGLIRLEKGWYTESQLIQARRVGQNWVAKIGKNTFVWSSSFADHVEAPTFKQALEVLAKRQKKAGYILSLNDVRNDRPGTAGYCLAGVKSFLAARMPFVYRMVKQFQTWAEIPADILATDWHLAGPQVFSGYQNPVSA